MNLEGIFYIKKVYYGNYVKNIILPISFLTNIGNLTGKKNIGNKEKLRNNVVRARKNLIQKALYNFYYSKILSFVTLTYAENIQDVKHAKHDLQLFFKRLKHWWNNPIRVKYMGELKYFYVYEYQDRGAVHFHILLNRKIPYRMLSQWWPHAGNYKGIDLKTVRKGTNEFIIKYLSKYCTKALNDIKSLNQLDIGIKAYSFSRNCKNPIVVSGMKKIKMQDIIKASFKAKKVYYFKTFLNDNDKNTVLSGAVIESIVNNDYFKNIDVKGYECYKLEALWHKQMLRSDEIYSVVYKNKNKHEKIWYLK